MTARETSLSVSVVIPTHNPSEDYLARVIEALRHQTLEQSTWELILVDNGSKQPLAESIRQTAEGMRSEGESMRQTADGERHEDSLHSHLSTFPPFTAQLDLSWHSNARIVREEKLGLTFARLRGFAEAQGELVVMVDDDNVLAPDYLETAVEIAGNHPVLGAFGGRCLPEFEVEPEAWITGIKSGLGLRDRGEREEFFPEAEIAEGRKVGRLEGGKVKSAVREFPDCAPIGAGMVIRREAAAAYAKRLQARGARQGAQGKETITDRIGDSLASGGDNDICLTVLEEGWQVGYLPQLQLTHLIPKRRMTLDYQKRMAREAMRSFILMLDQHGIRPWGAIPRWSVPLRVAKDYLRVQPWRSSERLLKWCMNRGRYEACAALQRGAEKGKSGYRH